MDKVLKYFDDYTFSQTEIGEFKDRFTLQFTTVTLGIDYVLIEENFVVSSIENGIHVQSSDDVKSIRVFDILGKKILDENSSQSFYFNKVFFIFFYFITKGTEADLQKFCCAHF